MQAPTYLSTMKSKLAQLEFTQSEYAPFMQTAMVDIGGGVELCVEVGGDPSHPHVLMIMGLGAQMIYWPSDLIKKLIDKGLYVVRFDNRDVGLSTKFKVKGAPRPNTMRMIRRGLVGLPTHDEPLPYTLHDMADDTARLIDKLGLHKTNIIGGSMGGMIAQILAAKYPQKVHTLALLFTSNNRAFLPIPYPRQLHILFAKPKGTDEDSMVAHGVKVFQIISAPDKVDPEYIEATSRMFYRRSFYPLGYIQQFNAVVSLGSLAKYDKRIKAPTVVLHGSKDRLIRPKHGKSVANAIKGATYHEIKGMGHGLTPRHQNDMVNTFANHIFANIDQNAID